jgi:hypothetical protein
LKNLLQDSQIQECRLITTGNGIDTAITATEVWHKINMKRKRNSFFHVQKPRLIIPGTAAAIASTTTDTPGTTNEQVPDDIRRLYEKIDRDEEDLEDLKIVSFEVIQNTIEQLRKR